MERNIINNRVGIIISVVLLILLNFCECDSAPEVRTEFGTFIGHTMKTRTGRDLLAYQGIRYAKPPLGNLRFQEPVMMDKNSEVYNATNLPNICFQEDLDVRNGTLRFYYVGSEDCLYLNVYVPQVEKDVGKLPVMFFIHGGGYILGSGSPNLYGPEILLDRNIILVTINYRLSVLGFLSANDELPENLGMKDQLMALKWVKENIAAFGGDADSITIAGNSAGGASVTLHMLSPLSRGLFQRGIAHSGTLDCLWASKAKTEARKLASKIINYLGCSSEPQLLLRCLQKMPVSELFNAVQSLREIKLGFSMRFGPVTEKESSTAFITQKSIDQGSTLPLLTGLTSEESLPFYNGLIFYVPSYAELTPLKEDYKYLLPRLFYYAENSNADDITTKLVEHYIGDKGFSNETVVPFIKMMSDTMFNYGLHSYAGKHKGKLYQYLNDYHTRLAYFTSTKPPALKKRMGHGDDLIFFFTMEGLEPLTGDDLKFSNFLVDLWTNYIRFENPTPDSKLWKESERGSRYLKFTNDGHTMKTNMFRKRMAFLDSIEFHNLGRENAKTWNF